ncbi:MAG: acyltransferase [Steroidobacteraceae bacterium]
MTATVAARRAAPQLRSLQILRAIAATSVVYYHVGRIPQFGSFGVDLFFILSGFVIAMIADNKSSPMQFAADRITRVVPLYWILTTATLVAVAIAPRLFTETTANAADYIRSLLFIPYFKRGGALQPMLGVGWTLNYEMLFYALSTIALLSAPRRYFARTTTALVCAVWLVGMALPKASAYHLFFTQNGLLFEFIFGIFAWNIKGAAFWRHIPKSFILLVALASYVTMSYMEVIAAPFRPLSFGLPALLIVLAAFQLESALVRLPGRLVTLLVHIGDASYATYLTHLYCVDFGKRIIGAHIGIASVTSAPGAAMLIAVSLAVGSLVYLFVDRPSVKGARRLSRLLLSRAAR